MTETSPPVALANPLAPHPSETKALKTSAFGSVAIGLVALWFARISDSQAIALDGLFNLAYSATGFFTLWVSRMLARGDDPRFPMGYGYLEPLTNGMKGLLVLGVAAMAAAGSLLALLDGGTAIAAGPAIGYGIFATIACGVLALVSRLAFNRTGSPLIATDAKNWLLNALISSGVLATFIGLWLIEGTALERYSPYVDPALVLLIVLALIGVPIRMAWASLMELLNRAPAGVTEEVRDAITDATSSLPVMELFVRVIQPGRTRLVAAHVVLPPDYTVTSIAHLDEVRLEAQTALQRLHPTTFLDLVFVGDRSWGAPLAESEVER